MYTDSKPPHSLVVIVITHLLPVGEEENNTLVVCIVDTIIDTYL